MILQSSIVSKNAFCLEKTSLFKNIPTEKNVDFSLLDTSGKYVTLSSFKGKFVVLTMTAGWCGPCLQETPYIKELQNEFSDKDIVWIFIAFDRDMKDWKNTIHKEGLKGIHLYGKPVSSTLKKVFNFDSLPYFIWIDKDGTVAMSDAPRPSTHAAKRQLKYYLK
jgi:thiol-disulfide isomerase/thioredoxin